MLFKYMTVFLVALAATVHYEIIPNWNDLRAYWGFLLGISGMVFTIMGIWLAFIYPEAMVNLVKNDYSEEVDNRDAHEIERIEQIVSSVMQSALVAASLMFLYLVSMFFGASFNNVILTITVLLTFIQFESIYYVIKSNIDFVRRLHAQREKREQDNDV